MNTKEKDMSWGRFILFMIAFYGVLYLVAYVYHTVFQQAEAYDRKIKTEQLK